MDRKTETYRQPTLTRIGTFEEITQGNTTGANFDGNFVVGQPVPPGRNIFGDPTS